MWDWRHRAGWVARRALIGGTVLGVGMAFDKAVAGIPNSPAGMLIYHGGAATVDLFFFKATRFIATSHLRRDVEAIFAASIAANALGWALYMARTPPSLYDNLVMGLNYALAIRLLLGDGNVLDRIDFTHVRGLVRRPFLGSSNHLAKEEKR